MYLRRDIEKCRKTGELKRKKQEDESSLAVRLIFPRNDLEMGLRAVKEQQQGRNEIKWWLRDI